jgi:putative acetyltransferase
MTIPTIRRESISSPIANKLIGELNRELTELYPEPGATHFSLDPAEVAEGRGAFMVAYLDGRAVGCGAVRRLDTERAELKRMYVAPDLRGYGIGRALLAALEDEALKLGVRRLVLETGIRQMRALALYRATGFVGIPAFGEYRDTPTSVCLEKSLTVVEPDDL